MLDVTIHPCPKFNNAIDKLLLQLGHGWIITSYQFMYSYAITVEVMILDKFSRNYNYADEY